MTDYSVMIRADASRSMGSGHVMRCLTLADRLRSSGQKCVFLCSDLPGEMSKQIHRRGHRCVLLTSNPDFDPSSFELRDGAQCLQLLAEIQTADFDWIIVDHYQLGRRWHQSLRTRCKALMVIDDLADRDYDADLLLDPGWHRQPEHYRGRTNSACRILAGTRYALLRPEFTAARHASGGPGSRAHRVNSILLSMGGGDPDNITFAILEALSTLTWSVGLKIDIAFGAQSASSCAADFKPIASLRRAFSDVTLHRESRQMARLMLDADVAIGAAGSTSWERCCLGLPTLALIYADNQREAALALERTGAIALWQNTDELIDKLQRLRDNADLYHTMVSRSLAVCDGQGLERIVACLSAGARHAARV